MSQNRNQRASVFSHPEKQTCFQLPPFFLLLCTQRAPGNLPVLVLRLQGSPSPVTLRNVCLCRMLASLCGGPGCGAGMAAISPLPVQKELGEEADLIHTAQNASPAPGSLALRHGVPLSLPAHDP